MSENLGEVKDPTTRLAVMLYHHIQQQIEMADTKAQFILGANALLAATVAHLYRGMAVQIFNPEAGFCARIASFLVLAMFVSMVSSFYCALMVAKPQWKAPAKEEENLYFFGGIELYGSEEFAGKFLRIGTEQMREGILKQVHTIARIAFDKFLRIRRSIDCMILALGLWAAAHVFLAFVA